MTAHLEIAAGGIAVITLDTPPVNGLDLATRTALAHAFARVRDDGHIHGAVLRGAGRLFSAGGDIREMGTPAAGAPPGLSSHVQAAIEACAKPIIAALHGAAVGGGLETALACHARVALADTRLALPETGLGIIPLSGTQRLPRLLGLEIALEMIVFGRRCLAQDLAGQDLIDRLVPPGGDVLTAALELLRELLARDTLPALARDRPRAADAAAALREIRARLQATGGTRAQYAALEATAAGLEIAEFDAGMATARRIYDELIHSGEAQAARSAFLSRRAAPAKRGRET
jgi:enoyl-CoA hydratase